MAKKPQTKKKKRISKWVWVVIGVCVVAVYTFWTVANQRAKNQEKKDFYQAQVFVDGMKDKIQDKTGPADQVEKRNYCQRSNVGKTEKGPLNCVEAVYLLYLNKNIEEANLLMERVKSLYHTPINDNLALGFKQFTSETTMRSVRFDQEYESVGGLDCHVAYAYGITSFIDPAKEKPNKNLQIQASCAGDAMKQYFPMTN